MANPWEEENAVQPETLEASQADLDFLAMNAEPLLETGETRITSTYFCGDENGTILQLSAECGDDCNLSQADAIITLFQKQGKGLDSLFTLRYNANYQLVAAPTLDNPEDIDDALLDLVHNHTLAESDVALVYLLIRKLRALKGIGAGEETGIDKRLADQTRLLARSRPNYEELTTQYRTPLTDSPGQVLRLFSYGVRNHERAQATGETATAIPLLLKVTLEDPANGDGWRYVRHHHGLETAEKFTLDTDDNERPSELPPNADAVVKLTDAVVSANISQWF